MIERFPSIGMYQEINESENVVSSAGISSNSHTNSFKELVSWCLVYRDGSLGMLHTVSVSLLAISTSFIMSLIIILN
jgi:hypothetical protein